MTDSDELSTLDLKVSKRLESWHPRNLVLTLCGPVAFVY
jgi:hypothetical protein